MENFRDVIEQWPDVSSMAEDIDRKPNLIRKWKERDRIPAETWLGIVKAAERRGYRVTLEDLARLASKRKGIK